MKRILIVGASSFAGSNLALFLRKKYRVMGTYFHHRIQINDVLSFRFPLSTETKFKSLIRIARPDVILYCAGERNESKCSQSPIETLFLNAGAPSELFRAAREVCPKIPKFIYFSSSKVFSGVKGHYSEEDIPDGQSSYGRSKLAGEEALSRFENTYILRLGTLFGLGSSGQDSIVNRFLTSLWKKELIPLIHDEYRSFFSVDDLCRAIDLIIESETCPEGIYHLGNPHRESYYDFGLHLAHAFNLQDTGLLKISGKSISEHGFRPEDRGHDLSLSTDRFSKLFPFHAKETEFSLRLIQYRLRKGTQ